MQADARTLADQINRIFRERRSKLQRAVVAADTWTNSLIISGYPEDIETIKRLVSELDETKAANKETRVYMLKEADASVLAQTLMNVLTEGGAMPYGRYYYRRGREEIDEPQITEDTRLNALVITAKVEDFEMIEKLIKELDVALPEAKEEPRIYPLKYADARDVADILNELFSDRESTFGFFFFMSQSRTISGLSGKVKVIPDPATNSIVAIASSPRGFEVVEKLVEQLDAIDYSATAITPHT